MSFGSQLGRLGSYYQRNVASLMFRRPLRINLTQPIVSFTFDDFPRSALYIGGEILEQSNLVGTYYLSLGLSGQNTATGSICLTSDVQVLLQRGHELGCHTFSHCHSWTTNPELFENSIVENRRALQEVSPTAEFKSFSYPISPPRPLTKFRVARHFACSRAGGQTFNAGIVDLNQLSAFFIEKSRGDVEQVKKLIDRNQRARGWLILATHDVCDAPTGFGCKPAFFEEVVQYSVRSGARILPVGRALEYLTSGQREYAA